MKKWKCTVCGYVHVGENPPDKCPVCGAGKNKFKLMKQISQLFAAETAEAAYMNKTKLLEITYLKKC